MSLKNWTLAIRPKTLFAAASPVLVGSAVAISSGSFSLLIFALCLMGALLLQIESNLANDYFDWKKGSDTHERLGPVRVTSSGLISPDAMIRGMVATAVAAVGVGAVLTLLVGWPILIIGATGFLCAFLYTAGPFPLSRLGIADFFVFIFFGPIAVIGTCYAHTGAASLLSIFLSLPVGFVAVAILLVNNIRDLQEDIKTGKRTSVVRIGRSKSIQFYQACVTIPILAGVSLGAAVHASMFVILLAAPMTLFLIRQIRILNGAALNPLLGLTGLYLLLTSLLFCVGVLL